VGASSFAIYLREQDAFEAAHAVDGGRTLPVSALPPLGGSLSTPYPRQMESSTASRTVPSRASRWR
jgi:hypothetical protein